MLTKLRNLKEEHEQGFTLIELLVVILIIGILSAIAIPAFLNQRKSAVDASLKSDLANSAKQIATWGVKQGAKTTPLPEDLTQGSVSGNYMLDDNVTTLSDGTQLAFTGDNTGYCIQGWNDGGELGSDGKFLAYDSGAGGMLNADSSPVNCPGTVLSSPIHSEMGEDSTDGEGEENGMINATFDETFTANGQDINLAGVLNFQKDDSQIALMGYEEVSHNYTGSDWLDIRMTITTNAGDYQTVSGSIRYGTDGPYGGEHAVLNLNTWELGAFSTDSTSFDFTIEAVDMGMGDEGMGDEVFEGVLDETVDIWDWRTDPVKQISANVSYDASTGEITVETDSAADGYVDLGVRLGQQDFSDTIHIEGGYGSIMTDIRNADEMTSVDLQIM